VENVVVVARLLVNLANLRFLSVEPLVVVARAARVRREVVRVRRAANK
jgi:hypothetical protein